MRTADVAAEAAEAGDGGEEGEAEEEKVAASSTAAKRQAQRSAEGYS